MTMFLHETGHVALVSRNQTLYTQGNYRLEIISACSETCQFFGTREEKLRKRRERDRLRRHMETTKEREARFINALIMLAIYS